MSFVQTVEATCAMDRELQWPATSPGYRQYIHVIKEQMAQPSRERAGGVSCGIVLSYDSFYRLEIYRRLTYCPLD